MVQHLRSGKALPKGPFEPPQYKKTGRGHLLFSAATFLFLHRDRTLSRQVAASTTSGTCSSSEKKSLRPGGVGGVVGR